MKSTPPPQDNPPPGTPHDARLCLGQVTGDSGFRSYGILVGPKLVLAVVDPYQAEPLFIRWHPDTDAEPLHAVGFVQETLSLFSIERTPPRAYYDPPLRLGPLLPEQLLRAYWGTGRSDLKVRGPNSDGGITVTLANKATGDNGVLGAAVASPFGLVGIVALEDHSRHTLFVRSIRSFLGGLRHEPRLATLRAQLFWNVDEPAEAALAANARPTAGARKAAKERSTPLNPPPGLRTSKAKVAEASEDERPALPLVSMSLHDALCWAKGIAALRARSIDPHMILLGILVHGRRSRRKDASHFLREWLFEHAPFGDVDPSVALDLGSASKELPKKPAGAYEPTDFDERGLDLLATAEMCAKSVSGQNLAMRHLLGALLLGPKAFDHAHDAGLVGEKGFAFQKLAEDYLEFIGTTMPAERERWREWARRDGLEQPAVERAPARSLRAGYDADLPIGVDRLDIEDDVATLCSVILDEKHPPPLSVGLFGDWGSGKSFFIGKMKERIRDVTEQTRKARELGMPTTFVGRAPQIEFNAWHFVDANLWASLVTHLFGELHREIFGERPSPEAQKAEQLYEELETTQKRVEALEREVRAATDLVTDAEIKKRQAEQDLLNGKKAIDVFRRMSPDTLRVLVLQDPEVQNRFDRLTNAVGEGRKSAEEIRAVTSDLFTTLGKARRFVLENRRVSAVIALLFLVGLLLASPLGQRFLDASIAVIAPAVTWLAGIVTLLGKGVPYLNRVKELLGTAENVRQDLLRTEQSAVDRAELAQKEARERLAEQESVKQRLLREIAEARRGLGLEGFLQQRLGDDGGYKAKLGIVAMVRQDFDTLTDRLRKGIEVVDDGAQQTIEKIDRVILYIDDLDRCPPDRVVEVLQAVHLLLAVPLFVVVVAADPRWLLHSLRKHYSDLLQTGSRESENARPLTEEEARWESTPQQYLEKIFQIPYTLPPMGPDGFRDLVKDLLTPAADETPSIAQTAAVANAEPDAATAAPLRAPEAPEAANVAAAAAQSTPPQSDTIPRAAKPAAAAGTKAETPAPWEPKFDLAPRSLELGDDEREYFGNLAPLVSTPRSAKRLVNVYRLLRANLGPNDLARLEAGDFRIAQLLLATLIGFPDQAPELFLDLCARDHDEIFWKFVETTRKTRGAPAAAPRGRKKTANGSERRAAHEWSRMCTALAAIEASHAGAEEAGAFVAWVDEVSRYSFRAGHLLRNLAGNGESAAPQS